MAQDPTVADGGDDALNDPADVGVTLFRKHELADPAEVKTNKYREAAEQAMGLGKVELIDLELGALRPGNTRDVIFNVQRMFDANADAPQGIRGTARQLGDNAKDFVWTTTADQDGELDADSSIMIIHGNNVSGLVRQDGMLHEIIPIGDGEHIMAEIDPANYPEEDHPKEFENVADHTEEFLDRLDKQAKSDPNADAGSDADKTVIDVLVAWTPAVAASLFDPTGFAELAIESANESYDRSGVNIRLRLVDHFQTDYRESRSFDRDLTFFRDRNDGRMDEIHDRRQDSGADICVLLINNDESCGLANVILANDAREAFAVVHWSCAVGNHSFAHEIGHLQGARHDRRQDRSGTYNHGHVEAPQEVRTIMAYRSGCRSCERIGVWSSPDVKYNGAQMGDSLTADNARRLNETASQMGNLVQAVGGTETQTETQTQTQTQTQTATSTEHKEAYAFVHKPDVDRYTVKGDYHFNSSGGDIEVQRCSQGRYLVTFKGLGGANKRGGTVQATGFGDSGFVHAQVRGWDSDGNDFTAYVDCYNSQGNRADGKFTIHVFWMK